MAEYNSDSLLQELIEELNKILQDGPSGDRYEESICAKEKGILQLGEKYKNEGKAKELADLIQHTRPFLCMISKAKAAKLVRSLFDFFLDLKANIGIEIQLCKESIEWAKKERITFLSQPLETRLIELYFDTGMFTEALQLGSSLIKELKKLDDKNLLVEVLLLESKTYQALHNLPKARAALTSARATANSTSCPLKLQASLEFQSGILLVAEEQDFKTAFSYFCEAFEHFNSIDSLKALTALKYMLLSKLMVNNPEDVQQIISRKIALKYAGRDIEAMKSVAQACREKSLADFQQTLQDFKKELEEDVVVKAHLESLYDIIFEQNLCRIIEPYSHVQVDFISQSIKLPKLQVEKKLAQMILDKKLNGILSHEQGEVVLTVFEEGRVEKTHEMALEIINNMLKVVDTLYKKANK